MGSFLSLAEAWNTHAGAHPRFSTGISFLTDKTAKIVHPRFLLGVLEQ
jgi:hypothetical protein